MTFGDGVSYGTGVATAEGLLVGIPLPAGLKLQHGLVVSRPLSPLVDGFLHHATVRHRPKEVATCSLLSSYEPWWDSITAC
jgi:hypothetical protein